MIPVMAICAWLAFFFTTWLSQVPYLFFIVIGLFMIIAFSLDWRKRRVSFP